MKAISDKDTRMLKEIRISNLLSFGPETEPLPMERLNVFIGPNSAGKSNLIEALAIMRATPVSPFMGASAGVQGVLRRGGGPGEWTWKGAKEKDVAIDLVICNPYGAQPLRHVFSFRADTRGIEITDERVEYEKSYPGQAEPYFFYKYQHGSPVINVIPQEETDNPLLLKEGNPKQPTGGPTRKLKRLAQDAANTQASVLSQFRDREHYPELTYLGETYEKWRIYREWAFGRNTVFREPQKADMRNDRLEEDFSNLGMFLSRLRKTPKAKREIIEALRDLYAGIADFETIPEGGSVQLFFTEGDYSIPATRLSDGTLRYLCLLAILCDPDPPPVICIEEPELGLHPDILPKLADRLVAASQRTQIIVTTHSDILVDAMTEHPESVVVCEKHDGCTEMTRLKKEELAKWLEKYRLGQLWIDGQIGGKRW